MNNKSIRPATGQEVEPALVEKRPVNRREFLARSGLIAGGVATAGLAGNAVAQSAAPAAAAATAAGDANLPPNIPSWTRSLGGADRCALWQAVKTRI